MWEGYILTASVGSGPDWKGLDRVRGLEICKAEGRASGVTICDISVQLVTLRSVAAAGFPPDCVVILSVWRWAQKKWPQKSGVQFT